MSVEIRLVRLEIGLIGTFFDLFRNIFLRSPQDLGAFGLFSVMCLDFVNLSTTFDLDEQILLILQYFSILLFLIFIVLFLVFILIPLRWQSLKLYQLIINFHQLLLQ